MPQDDSLDKIYFATKKLHARLLKIRPGDRGHTGFLDMARAIVDENIEHCFADYYADDGSEISILPSADPINLISVRLNMRNDKLSIFRRILRAFHLVYNCLAGREMSATLQIRGRELEKMRQCLVVPS